MFHWISLLAIVLTQVERVRHDTYDLVVLEREQDEAMSVLL